MDSDTRVVIKGDPHWCDWEVTITRPMVAWWELPYRNVLGDRLVPAEVGEVLLTLGFAIPRVITTSRDNNRWCLPWITKDLIL